MRKQTGIVGVVLLTLLMLSTPSWGRDLTVGGSLTLEYQVLTESTPYEGQFQQNLQLDLGSFAGNTNLVVGLDITDIEDGLRIREAYGELYTDSTDWIIGTQFIPWGVMDGASPTDVINPVNYTNPLNSDNRVAVPAVRARHYVGDWELDGVWVPRFEPHVLPQALPNHDVPELAVSNGEVGVRVSRWLPGMDAAAVYYYGWDKQPIMQLDTESQVMSFVHQRYHMIGASATKDFGALVGRAEAAYFFPELTDSFLQYAVGFDRYLTHELFLLAQLNGVVDGDENPMTLMASLQYEISPHMQASLNGIYSITDRDLLLNPSISWDAADGLEIAAGLFFIGGDGPMGSLKPLQNAYVRVTFTF